jgi:toxin ParE1/3/4
VSLPNRSINLSFEAETDFEDILQYTEETWNADQADRYAAKLDQALNRLSRNPGIGRKRDAYFSGCYIHTVGRHLIVYTFSDTMLNVVRILHDRTDVKCHF